MIGGAPGQVNERAKRRLPKRLRIGFRSTGWSPLTKSPNLNDSACGTMFRKMPLSAGERIGFYEILGPLGAGGMGVLQFYGKQRDGPNTQLWGRATDGPLRS